MNSPRRKTFRVKPGCMADIAAVKNIFNTRVGPVKIIEAINQAPNLTLSKYPKLYEDTYSHLQIMYLTNTILERFETFGYSEITEDMLDKKIQEVLNEYQRVVETNEFKGYKNLVVANSAGGLSFIRNNVNRVLNSQLFNTNYRVLHGQKCLLYYNYQERNFNLPILLEVSIEEFEKQILPEIVVACLVRHLTLGVRCKNVIIVPKDYLKLDTAPSYTLGQCLTLLLLSLPDNYELRVIDQPLPVKAYNSSAIRDPEIDIQSLVSEDAYKSIEQEVRKDKLFSALTKFFQAVDPSCRGIEPERILAALKEEAPKLEFQFEEIVEEAPVAAETISEQEREEMLASLASMGLLAENVNPSEDRPEPSLIVSEARRARISLVDFPYTAGTDAIATSTEGSEETTQSESSN